MKDITRIFKALSDTTRLRIIRLLVERELCVCELVFILEMEQSRISHQLRILRDVELVEDKREGQWIVYSIPRSVRDTLVPLLNGLDGPGPAESEDRPRDRERLGLCLNENVRKERCRMQPEPGARP